MQIVSQWRPRRRPHHHRHRLVAAIYNVEQARSNQPPLFRKISLRFIGEVYFSGHLQVWSLKKGPAKRIDCVSIRSWNIGTLRTFVAIWFLLNRSTHVYVYESSRTKRNLLILWSIKCQMPATSRLEKGEWVFVDTCSESSWEMLLS